MVTNKEKPTQTVHTQRAYKKRAFELIRRCRKELKIHMHDSLDNRQFVGWLISLKPSISRSSWRQYKSSVVYALETEIQKYNDPVAQEALELLLPIDVSGCVQKTKKTSGAKQKKITPTDLWKIIRYLDATPNLWHTPLKRFLLAGILTGLRPSEWASAVLSKTVPITLTIRNAKNTNGRAHGETRTLHLENLTADEIQIISEHQTKCNEWAAADQFDHYYRACANVLSRVVRTLWPNRTEYITLYSTRHQFSANAKASGFTREEIAAMMGHAVDDTATKHYGKKTAGKEIVRVKADPNEVKKIRKTYLGRFEGNNEPTPKQK